ncbi:MAG: ABC transporter substrate-binding protein [Symbiobacterium sp.]|uniref:ABC transporter substrate-binding protein n=1 Tax=Symbiobacterium sp. TaxID=1971213 RepID=UPI003463F611
MRRKYWLLSLVLAGSLVLAACGGQSQPSQSTAPDTGSNTSQTQTNQSTQSTSSQKKTVTILGAVVGVEEAGFLDAIADFEAAHPDIDVQYTGTSEFATLVEVKVQGGDAPDIAMFPQPGGAQRMAEQGQLVPMWPELEKLVDQNYEPMWKELGTFNGTPYGVFHRVNAKGWFWYNKPAFEAAGYQVPKTWDELMDLMAQMRQTGIAPLCEGIADGDATGWKGTDWIESILLRTQSPETYDKWVSHELKFNSPEVRKAFELLGDIWMTEGNVYGGVPAIASGDVQDVAQGLFTDPPQCWLHFQGSFVTGFFQEDVQKDLDNKVGVFIMPPIDPNVEPGLAVGGDILVVFKGHDRPEVKEFMEWIASVDSTKTWAAKGGALFPHKGQDLSIYPTELERTMAETIINAKAGRFDGSDSMPAELNRAFWTGITNWVTGAADLDTVLQQIDASME